MVAAFKETGSGASFAALGPEEREVALYELLKALSNENAAR